MDLTAGNRAGRSLAGASAPSRAFKLKPLPLVPAQAMLQVALCSPLPLTDPDPDPMTSQPWTCLLLWNHLASWTPGCPRSLSPDPLCSLCLGTVGLGPIVRALSYLLCFIFTPSSPSPVEQPQSRCCLADRLEGGPIPLPS